MQIECHVEASPKSINYWIKDAGKHFCHLYLDSRSHSGARWMDGWLTRWMEGWHCPESATLHFIIMMTL